MNYYDHHDSIDSVLIIFETVVCIEISMNLIVTMDPCNMFAKYRLWSIVLLLKMVLGDIEEAHITPGTSSQDDQYCLLRSTVISLQHNLTALKRRLVDAEGRLTLLESCDCKKSCKENNVTRNDGEEWTHECTICKCHQGDFACRPLNCAVPKCKHPQPMEGESCPQCRKNCYFRGVHYDDGEKKQVEQTNCECRDGNMVCIKDCVNVQSQCGVNVNSTLH